MEIEVKLKYNDKSKITNWLRLNGFTFSKNKEVRDTYYGLADGSMSNKNKLYRLREVVGVLKEITLKDSLEDSGGVWTRREINVIIDDIDGMKTILDTLNCKLIKENFSIREIWNKGDIEFAFIDFSRPAELHIAEIEGPDVESVQKCIESIGENAEVAGEDVFAVFDKKL